MRIGLIDVDSHNFPNIALMKISAWHKQQGDDVEWWIGLKHYDRVYQSKVFDETYTKDIEHVIMADEVIRGGTGYDLHKDLPEEIEHIYPDYDLYGITDTAFGFLTRGCPRHCPFCLVGEKEGLKAHRVADLSEFWKGQKNIVIMDSNLLACKDSSIMLKELADSGAYINFNQGLDVRLMTDEHCSLINQMKVKMLHMAWDNFDLETYYKLKQIRPLLKFNHRNLIVYVLTNYNTTHVQDLERVMILRELGYDPFIMIYNKPSAPEITRQLARWVNNKFIFWATESFNEYDPHEKTKRLWPYPLKIEEG